MTTYNIDWQSGGDEGIPGKEDIILPEKTLDSSSTSLVLTGKGVSNYGEIQQENFIRMLENFASETPPANATIGQFWYHAAQSKLYVCVDPAGDISPSLITTFPPNPASWSVVWPIDVELDGGNALTLNGQTGGFYLNSANHTGTIPLSRGGTNSTTTVAGGVVYGTATALVTTVAGTSGHFLVSGGAGAPAWLSPASVTGLNAGALTAGTVATARLGTGTANNTTFLRGDNTWAAPPVGGGGTVTSVSGTGTVSGITLSGTVTTTGNLTLGGTLSVSPSNFSSQAQATFLAAPAGSAGVPSFRTIAASDVPTLNQNTTGTAANVTGTVAIANGGTGATTVAGARTALGTTVGANLLGLTNPSAITFLRVNADNTVTTRSAADFRTDIGAGTGTVTAVTGTSPVASSGGATPAISLSSGYGDTQNPYAAKAANRILAGPASGGDAVPGFRALVLADMNATPTGVTTGTVVSRGASGAVEVGPLTATTGTFSGALVTSNTTASTSTGTGALRSAGGLGVAGAIWCNTLNAVGDITAFATSDQRLKTAVETIPNALSKVTLLRGVTFNWNEEAVKVYDKDITVREAGVIAQEVKDVMPETVTTRDDGFMAVRYEKLVPLLIEAVKELSAEVEKLRAEVSARKV